MGDHRADIQISMQFHGITVTRDMWINYFPGEVDGVDDRVIAAFREAYERGMSEYYKKMEEYEERLRKKEATVKCPHCMRPLIDKREEDQ